MQAHHLHRRLKLVEGEDAGPHQRRLSRGADGRLGFNAEGAAVANKYAGKIRAAQVAVEKDRLVNVRSGPAAGLHDGAIGKHHGDAHDIGPKTRCSGSARYPASKRYHMQRGKRRPHVHAFLPAGKHELINDNSCLCRDGHSCRVDFNHLVHARHIKQHGALRIAPRRAVNGGAAPARDNRDAMPVGKSRNA